MRFLKVLAVLISGPIAGILFGFIIALLLLPHPSGMGVAPGDGILIILCVGGGLILFTAASVLAAIWTWRREGRKLSAPAESGFAS
jgi:hypothetical protein